MSLNKKKPLSRVEQKRLRTKEEILGAALDILSDHGVERLTLAAVTEKMGFTKPAIYHYFRSKEDLVRSLVLQLLHQETDELIEAISKNNIKTTVLGVLIRAFYGHYRTRLHAFRLIYCQSQLMDMRVYGLDKNTIQQDINPLTQRLFDTVVSILSDEGRFKATDDMRKLAFSAWLSAIGLIEMISISDAYNDPLRYSDESLLKTMEETFNAAAERVVES